MTIFSQVFQLNMVPFAPIKPIPYFIMGPKVFQKHILGLFRALNEGFTQFKTEAELFDSGDDFQSGFSTNYGPFCPNKIDPIFHYGSQGVPKIHTFLAFSKPLMRALHSINLRRSIC